MKRPIGIVIPIVGILGISFTFFDREINDTSNVVIADGKVPHIDEMTPTPMSNGTLKRDIIERLNVIERANEIVAKMPHSEVMPDVLKMKKRLAVANENWRNVSNELSLAVAEVEKARFQVNQLILNNASPEEIEALNQELLALVEAAQWKEQEMNEAYRAYMSDYEAEIEKLTLIK